MSARETARGSILVRRAAKDGKEGIPGLIWRGPTRWEIGKEYRNDINITSTADGFRIVDVVTDVDIALEGTDTFNAFICRRNHTSSAQHPLVEGPDWTKMNSLKPTAMSLLLASRILAKYINVENLAANNAFLTALTAESAFVNKLVANQSFIEDLAASRIFATTLSSDVAFITNLVAQNAFLQNAVIRLLKSDESPNKRIEIINNQMTMYDSSNKQKLLIKGENIDIGTPTASYPTEQLSISRHYEGRGRQGQDRDSMTICTFRVDAANTQVIIPRLTIVGNVTSQGGYGGSIESTENKLTLAKDGAFYSTLTIGSGQGWGGCTYGGATFNLQPGTYTIVFDSSWEWEVDYDEPLAQHNWIDYVLTNISTGNILVASGSQQSVQIGANGLAIHLGNAFSAVFALDNNQAPTILLQGINSNAQTIGLRISSAGVQVNRGSGWVSL